MDVCQKIEVFENYVLKRQLRIAQILGKHFVADQPGDPLAESAFAILSIGFSFFEMIEQFSRGESSHGQSSAFFKGGFNRVFPHSAVAPNDVTQLYGMVRCGMYHTAMPTKRCSLSRRVSTPFANLNGEIAINPALMIESLVVYFHEYCADLRDGLHCDLQRRFETMFDSFSESVGTAPQSTSGGTRAPWEQ